jgi:hypothetical protein
VGFFHFLGILPKNRLFRLFSVKIGLYATSCIYSESAQKTLPENIHFLNCGESVEILGEKLGLAAFSFLRKKNAATFFFTYFLETT